MHFGAFFKRDWRENDYLWGRLDGAGRLLGMLGEAFGALRSGVSDDCGRGARRADEIPELFAWVDEKVAELDVAGKPAAVPA